MRDGNKCVKGVAAAYLKGKGACRKREAGKRKYRYPALYLCTAVGHRAKITGVIGDLFSAGSGTVRDFGPGTTKKKVRGVTGTLTNVKRISFRWCGLLVTPPGIFGLSAG
jgi:hypothetical protein